MGPFHFLFGRGRLFSGVWDRRDDPRLPGEPPERIPGFLLLLQFHHPDQRHLARGLYLEDGLAGQRKKRTRGFKYDNFKLIPPTLSLSPANGGE